MNIGSKSTRRRSVARTPARLDIASWRELPEARFDPEAAKALRETLATIVILDEPLWRRAAAGDSDAAVKLAFRLNADRSTGMAYDLVMTAVAACAAEGCIGACIVMSLVLCRMPGASKRMTRLAAAWLERCEDMMKNEVAE